MAKVPVLLVIFRRPGTTLQVINAIKNYKPDKLYIAADTAREQDSNEVELVRQTREIVSKNIDWQCEVKLDFPANNLGLKKRISSAIDWVFESEREVIILEDDCFPLNDFFIFCESMLDKYKNDNRIFSITGTNLLFKRVQIKESYFFSRYHSCWGWATWKRAWDNYDAKLALYSDLSNSKTYLSEYLSSKREAKYWCDIVKRLQLQKINSWAYIWSLTAYKNGGLQIVPNKNLIKNLGFNCDATHTKFKNCDIVTETCPLEQPLIFPSSIHFQPEFDKKRRDFSFSKTLRVKFYNLLKNLCNRFRLN